MFTANDLVQIKERGSSQETVNLQIENFKKGFPFLRLKKAATPEKGIIVLSHEEVDNLISFYDQAAGGQQIVKFVPASGAASRMFKMLFEFLEFADNEPKVLEAFAKGTGLQSIGTFFNRISDFAFAPALDSQLQKNGMSIQSCLEKKDYASVLRALLENDGLGYGKAPKGLLEFHKYERSTRTPTAEHLAEGAMYARSADQTVKIHFTVSPEHRADFENHIKKNSAGFEEKFGINYDVSFSEQKAYTDTIAVDAHNEPFREADGSLLFRPAGHGALIANLNEIDADIIFVKNIDNVVPDRIKEDTVDYKKALAGILLKYRSKLFDYLSELESPPTEDKLDEMLSFLSEELNTEDLPSFADAGEKIKFLRAKFNRPLRICGMVKNEGEPGGGPFFAKNSDGTQSLQIAESSQIDYSDERQKNIADHATHFNPVDLVCGVKDYKGNKFDLTKYADAATGFISKKSKDGRELKAQELPGLWNGAMSDWNTIFVEVPISTFNPVKTVNDLLRPQHQ